MLPSVDETAASSRLSRPCRSGERRGDQRPRLCRIDDIIDLEQGGGIQGLCVSLCGIGEVANPLLTLLLIGDRIELLSQCQPDRALKAHWAEVSCRPGKGEQRLVQAAPYHRLSAEPVASAQDHRD